MASQQSQLLEDQLKSIVDRTVYDIVKALDNGMKAPETIPIICYSCRELRMGNALCTLHRYDYPDLNDSIGSDKTCDLCLKWKTAPKESPEHIDSLSSRFNILKTLESISNMLILKITFPDFIPQVGAQLCSIFEDSVQDSLQNIAAFPGRIIQVQGKAKIVSRPEFNSSKTTGNFLLDIRKENKKITSVLSIKNQNDHTFEHNLEEKGFSIIKTSGIDEKGLKDQLSNKEYSQFSKIAIIDSGSIGYESITYLFVENIFNLVEIFD